MDMKERLQELAENARKRIEESEGLDKLNDVRVAYLGKKGELTAILKGMMSLRRSVRRLVSLSMRQEQKSRSFWKLPGKSLRKKSVRRR